MGLCDDPVAIIAWDTDEAIVESIVDHSMPVPLSKRANGDSSLGSKTRDRRMMTGSHGQRAPSFE
jgi:hypothetical protein